VKFDLVFLAECCSVGFGEICLLRRGVLELSFRSRYPAWEAFKAAVCWINLRKWVSKFSLLREIERERESVTYQSV
jgi:hypothetical protein